MSCEWLSHDSGEGVAAAKTANFPLAHPTLSQGGLLNNVSDGDGDAAWTAKLSRNIRLHKKTAAECDKIASVVSEPGGGGGHKRDDDGGG